jgi:monoamine oxidase
VDYLQGGQTRTETADYLICAIPFSLLRGVHCEPALSPAKTKAIAEWPMMEASRAYFTTRSRFWQRDPLGPIGGIKIAKTDTWAERIWDLSNTQPGDEGLITCYLQSKNAQRFDSLLPEERESAITKEIIRYLPELEREKTAYGEIHWASEPWAKGAWTSLRPGQWWMAAEAARPEHRIHFAGEHTSIWAGWMQGAIESGKRAVQEVLAG